MFRVWPFPMAEYGDSAVGGPVVMIAVVVAGFSVSVNIVLMMTGKAGPPESCGAQQYACRSVSQRSFQNHAAMANIPHLHLAGV